VALVMNVKTVGNGMILKVCNETSDIDGGHCP
jgi:hypothetical protein